jgi:uncharacterized delta-60 repeat protein
MTRLRLSLLALIFCGLLVAVPAASAAPGDLDPSFGSGGMVKLLESEEESYGEGIAVQPDGKVVIAGEEKGNAVVLRLLADGQLDPSFGSGGKVTTTVAGSSEFQSVAIQPDGKIVAAGAGKAAGDVDFLFARYSPDGSPDMSFGGGDGIETVPVGSEEDQVQDVNIASDGRIVATGTVELPGSNNAVGVVVLEPNGAPDASFGGDGSLVKETVMGEGDDRGVAAAMLGDGSVLVGDANGAGGGNGFTLMKLLPSGEYDPSFGEGDGIAFTPIPVIGTEAEFGAGRITDFAVLPDGRIIASGYGLDYFAVPPNPPTYHLKFAAVRWLPDGELDPSFAEGGIFTRHIGDYGSASAVALAQGGGYLFAGYYEIGSMEPPQNAAWVGRLKPDGTPDPAFGTGGFVLRTDTAPFGEYVENAAVDSADRLVTVGTAYGANNTSSISVTRYLGDPQPVPISAPGPAPVNQPPHATIKPVPKKVRADKLKGFFGTASDPDGNGVQRVQVAVVKVTRGGAQASREPVRHCLVLKNAKLRFKRLRVHPYGACPQRWLTVRGKAKWSFKFKRQLPPGKYVVYARAVDGKGLAETSFSRKLRNRYGFRVVASKVR